MPARVELEFLRSLPVLVPPLSEPIGRPPNCYEAWLNRLGFIGYSRNLRFSISPFARFGKDRMFHAHRVEQFSCHSQDYGVRVGRYVLMPDHIHLFAAFGVGAICLSTWIKSLKNTISK